MRLSRCRNDCAGVWNYNTAARVSTGSGDKGTPDTTAEASPAKVATPLLHISWYLLCRPPFLYLSSSTSLSFSQ